MTAPNPRGAHRDPKTILAAMVALVATTGLADASSVTQTNLISSGSPAAKVVNSIFINPWGMSYGPGGAFWISANGWGDSPIYSLAPTAGAIPSEEGAPTIPKPAGDTASFSAPDGQVFNGTNGFVVKSAGKSGPALFLFATEDGTISGWNPTVNAGTAITVVNNYQGGKGAVYKGLALYTDAKAGTFLLAANFRSGLVEVYDPNFALVGEFRDHELPANYAPFNVQVLGGQIYVTYATQDAAKHDDAPGNGNGTVEIVDLYGTPSARLGDVKVLNSAWGLALAPTSWGTLAGKLLVGNFGNGKINAFDPATLEFTATLATANGKPLAIPGLWGLIPGNDGKAGSSKAIYFSAGPKQETGGLFGSLTFNP
jgi:uncharacterized protein (TIGR03118 family)